MILARTVHGEGAAVQRAVLFDLDGTLCPRRASVETFAEVFARDLADRLHAIETAELARALVAADHGGYNPRRAEDLVAALPWRDPPDPAFLRDYWARNFAQAVVPQPGLLDVLDALIARGLRIGVVTNGPVEGQRRKLERLAVRERIHHVVISEAAGCEKPDPRIFALAAEGVGADAGDCWFVGDHPEKDVLGAARCGMRAVWIDDPVSGFPWPSSQPAPAHRIERLEELLGIVGSV